jgi:hypothetical protein
MVQVEVDKTKRLLRVSWSQHVSTDETKSAVDKLPALVAEFTGGFRLLTDLTSLDTMDLGCVPHLRRMMDILNKAGVELIVRVIPDPHKDIGLNIMSLFHYRRGLPIVTFERLPEAVRILSV